MKKSMRKIFVLFLVSVMIILSAFSSYANCTLKLVKPSSLSGNQALDLVAVAKANLSKTGSELGATEHWCADFIYNCARLAGIGEDIIPTSGRVSTLHDALIACGGKEVTTPQAGDIVFYGPSHAAIMADSLYAYQGNFSGKGSGQAFWTSSKVVYCKYNSATNYAQYGATFVRPKYKATVSATPQNTLTINYYAGGGTVVSDRFSLVSDKICTKDGKDFNDVWTYNQTKTGGLYNISSFGLKKEGHHFSGWVNKEGTVFDPDDAKLTPKQIEPAVEKASCKVTLTAAWEPNILTIHYNANGGSVSTSTKYKLDEQTGNIHKLVNGNLVSVDWTYNETKSAGLYNASTFSLKRDGYKFIGWSNEPTGRTVFGQDDATLRPSDFSKDIISGSCEVTMYACWETNHKHTVLTDTAIEPTCTQSGITEGSHCSECGFVIKYQDEIPALGHNFASQAVTDIEPTCTIKGQSSRHCERCEEKTDIKTIPAKGHTLADRTDKKATLQSDGAVSTVCTECGYIKKTVVTSKIENIALSKAEYLYNGKVRKPTVKVSDSKGKALVLNEDYTLTFSSSSSTSPNKYKVKISFKNRYSGSTTLYYIIRPTMVKSLKVKSPEKKTVTLSWGEVFGATGYEVYYCAQKDGEYKKLATAKTNSYEYKKMASGKTFYFKVRAYKYSGGERIYGNYSKIYQVTVK